METTKKQQTSLDAILARTDYKRLTKNLKERVEEIAAQIRKKMIELDIEDDAEYKGIIGCRGVKVAVCNESANGFSYNFLGFKAQNDDYIRYRWHSLEDVAHSYYFAGDFNARIEGASNNEALLFLSVARELIIGLGEIEKKKAEAIEKALQEY